MPEKEIGTEPRFSARQVALATALCAGWKVAEAAQAAEVSERWAYEVLKKDKALMDELRSIIRPLVKVNIREVKEIAFDEAKKELERRLGNAFTALDESLVDPKTRMDAAREILNRNLGKVPSGLHVTGGTRNETTLKMDASVVKTLSDIVNLSGPLYAAAKQLERPARPVIDVSPS